MVEQVDVVVIGGGTAGLQAALQLAKVGRSVMMLERRPEGKSGARWCNGVVAWQFERAGLSPPVPPELRSADAASGSVMVSPTGRHRFRLPSSPILEADMRELVERLRTDAVAAGVHLRWGVAEPRVRLVAGRPRSITATAGGATFEVRAELFVDASGRGAVVRHQVPELDAICPDVAASDMCSAQQLLFEVADRDGALAFLKHHQADLGDAVVALGVEGGYSTLNIRVEPSLDEVSVLTGAIPALGHATGPEMVKRARARHPWIGAPIFGGGGLIPLRRVYDRFTAPGIALVGDAACQVMGGHGSGIGFGLIAGKVLAEAVEGASDPGDPHVLWGYQAGYLREFGAILAGYDAARRMSVRLGPDGVEELFASGIFSPSLVLPGLAQELGTLSPSETITAARTLASRPHIAKVVVPAITAMSAARALYRAYPAAPSARWFRAWTAASARVLPRQG